MGGTFRRMQRCTVILFLVSLMMALSVHVHAAETDADTEDQVPKQEKEKSGDRGFDPCLINPVLPVCKNDETL